MLRHGYCYDCQDHNDDQGYDSSIGSGRRAFVSGYCRVDDYRGGGDCCEDRYDRWGDQPWSPRGDYSWDNDRHDDRVPNPHPTPNSI